MVTGNFTGNHDMAACCQHFAGHTGQRVMGEAIIQYAVCDLIAQFIGMSLGHRFSGIKSFHLHTLLYRSGSPRR